MNLLFGWILGVLSSLFVDRIRKWLHKSETKKGILTELKDLQEYLAGLCVLSTQRSKQVTEEWAHWVRPFYRRFTMSKDLDYLQLNTKAASEVDKLNDQQFYDMMAIANTEPPTHTSPAFTEVSTPYFDAKYESVSQFSEQFQTLLAKLKKEIAILNTYIRQTWFYHTKTFDKVTDTNHDVIVANIENNISIIATRTRVIVNLIEKIRSL
jgi:hypothetical protein